MRAQHAALSHVERTLKEAQLPSLVWYDVLLELGRDPESGLRPFELERKMLLPQYGLSRLLDRIERTGYIRREPSEEDGRGQLILLTPAGKELLESMWPVYSAAIHEAVGRRLTASETALLGDLLDKLLPPKRGTK